MGLTILQELSDFTISLPQTQRMPHSLLALSVLKILDLQKNFSTLCDAKNNIKKTSKMVKTENLFRFLKLRSVGL